MMGKTDTIKMNDGAKPPKGKRIGEAVQPRTDAPEYISSKELLEIYPFTIFGAVRGKYQDRSQIRLNVAWQTGDGESKEVHKRVFTLDENQERIDLMIAVKENKQLTNCRLIRVARGSMGYLKIIDAANVGEYELQGESGTPTVEPDNIQF